MSLKVSLLDAILKKIFDLAILHRVARGESDLSDITGLEAVL
jgi:hypothetical protein